jgi:hypothetical protein
VIIHALLDAVAALHDEVLELVFIEAEAKASVGREPLAALL